MGTVVRADGVSLVQSGEWDGGRDLERTRGFPGWLSAWCLGVGSAGSSQLPWRRSQGTNFPTCLRTL